MQKKNSTTSETLPRDRLTYLWLALGTVLMLFGTARWTIPLAVWLYPVFLLRFVRTQPVWRGIGLSLLAIVLVLGFTGQGVFPIPVPFYYLVVFGMGVGGTLPYLIDRLLAPRLGGWLRTLVFPLAVTTLWYLLALVVPFGTFGNPAYTQYGNLPLLQLLSVTGIWGINLLMGWFAGLFNWAWERGFAWPRVRGGAALYSSLLALVLLCGGARLALFPPQASTVRVAGISTTQAVIAVANQQLWHKDGLKQALLTGTATPAERQIAHQALVPVLNDLLAQSLQEARAGAKIIVWPEGEAVVLQEDEAALLARASAFARTTGIYLDMALGVLLSHPVQSRAALDQSILIDPQGSVVWRYEKTHLAPVVEASEVPGNGQVPTVKTPYGRLASVICFDLDYSSINRQAGQAGVDIMLVPGGDWREIDPMHTQMATFTAIENGFSLVRPDGEGLAMTVDYEGNVLAASDYYTTEHQVIVASLPMQGVRTIYATIGDLFAWLSIAGLVVLIGAAIARRPKAAVTVVAEPIIASPTEATQRAVTDVRR